MSASGTSRSVTVGSVESAGLNSPAPSRSVARTASSPGGLNSPAPSRSVARTASSPGGLSRGFRQFTADPTQLSGGAAERELCLFGGQEVTVHRVIGVDADAAVHVHDAVRHPVPGVGGPERRAGHVDLGGEILRDAPGPLGEGEPQPFDIDVTVGQPPTN